jgi:hypothetical protein
MALAVLHYSKADARKNDRHEIRGVKSGINDLSDVQTRK